MISALFLFTTVLLSGFAVYKLKLNETKIKLMLAFSGSFLLTIACVELLPNAFAYNNKENLTVAYLLLGGFFLQVFIDVFSLGIEHGHIHVHKKNKIAILPISVGLFLHAFLEGMPLAWRNGLNDEFLWGLFFHKIPIAFAYGTLLKNVVNRNQLALAVILFASMTPLGILAGDLFTNMHIPNFKTYTLAITIGIFLHVSTTILLESGTNHRYNKQKIAVVLLGLACAIVPHIFMH